MEAHARGSSPKRRLTLLPLIAATYFMVSGGPYGLEELLGKQGYARSLLILGLVPLVWSLPTAFMVGELAAALPEEGGYYAWVRRACGPFWGFQEAWLSLAASVFDMAIYPTLFTLYLGRLIPALATGWPAVVAGALMIAGCAAWNLSGARGVGLASLVLTVGLLGPFVLLAGFAFLHPPVSPPPGDGAPPAALFGGVLVAMWNYMGWDNASTIAGEVDRPQRTYPLAMLLTVLTVALTYAIPVLAARHAGLDPRGWDTGAWVDAAGAVAGPWLGKAVILGGVLCAIGMFNALVLSYSRLPMVLAQDRLLPRVFARQHPRTGVPWVAVLACAAAYAACLGLGFARLVELDVILYGASLLLEFVALVRLRVREPRLPRPFRVPGGLAGAILLGVPPMLLVTLAAIEGRAERAGSLSALELGAVVVMGGPVVYWLVRRLHSR